MINLNANETLSGIPIQEESGKRFVTLGGHVSGSLTNGNLIYIPNQRDDVIAVKESVNASLRGFFSDFSLEKHPVTARGSSAWGFANQIKHLAERYAANTKDNPVRYNLFNQNCSTWVNTIMKIAGVSEAERLRLGDFRGFDSGQTKLLDENLFR